MNDRIVTETSQTDLIKVGGRWMIDVDRIISKERLHRIATGYECLNCHEKLTEPYPEVCPLIGCGYRIRDNQRRDFETAYRGEMKNLYEIDEEEDMARSREAILRDKGVWLPR